MGIKRCRLTKKAQLRLVEFFVLEVTARSAADLLGLQANTVALFYTKLRQLIIENASRDDELLAGEVEVDKAILAVSARASGAEALPEKYRSLGCLNGVEKCLCCRSMMPVQIR